jgi:hypothetical protein
MTTDRDAATPDGGPTVSTIDTAWGTVVRTREVLGAPAAVMLRRVARHHTDGVVLLDVRATSVVAPVVVGAVGDLAVGLAAHDVPLRIVRSATTPQELVAAACAPVHSSLAEALGCLASPWRPVDLPTRPTGRCPPATGGRGGTGPDWYPLPPGAPVRTRPAPLPVPRPRCPGSD